MNGTEFGFYDFYEYCDNWVAYPFLADDIPPVLSGSLSPAAWTSSSRNPAEKASGGRFILRIL
jgi:hypothetical protein